MSKLGYSILVIILMVGSYYYGRKLCYNEVSDSFMKSPQLVEVSAGIDDLINESKLLMLDNIACQKENKELRDRCDSLLVKGK